MNVETFLVDVPHNQMLQHLGPKADIRPRINDVRCVPQTDSRTVETDVERLNLFLLRRTSVYRCARFVYHIPGIMLSLSLWRPSRLSTESLILKSNPNWLRRHMRGRIVNSSVARREACPV
jgi:hypothetical protein